MKKQFKILTAVVVTGILATSGIAMAAEVPLGSSGAVQDTSYTLEEMMTYAIQDEYMAQAEYDAILDAFGSQRPFSNIINAEETHINLLLPLFETYGYAVPVNEAKGMVVLPNTLEDGYDAGVTAEVKNIEMYEDFLEEDLPADIQEVFEHLQAASEKHLSAFERAADGTMGTGNGSGSRSGRGNGSGQGGMNGGMGNGGSGTGNAGDCILN